MSAGKKIGKWVVFEDEVLGKGSMSKICKAQSSASGKDVVCKKVNKAALVGSLRQDELQVEVEILRRFRHQSVLQFYDVMQSKQSIYVVVEYSCGTLTEKHAHGIPPDMKWELFTQLILAVMHVHSRGIAHREIHPHNIQLSPFNEVKLTGFTNATRISRPTQFVKHKRTAVRFVAPEILVPNPRYTPSPEKSDLWGLGITLFYMENGAAPFDAGPPDDLVNRIGRGLYHMTREMSKEGKDICAKLVASDVARRVGLDLLVTNKHLAVDPARVAEAKGKHLEDRRAADVKEDVTVFDLGAAKGGGKELKKVVVGEAHTVHCTEDELPELAPVTIRKLADAYTGKAGGGVFSGHTANAKPKKSVFQP